jgi:hypothetical protein
VFDVAQALANAFNMPNLPGTFNLPGPSTLTHEYLLELVSAITYNPPSSAPGLPKAAAKLLAQAAQNVWWPALSPDQVERRFIDEVDVPGDWEVFGVQPQEIEPLAITYLRRYRSAYVFSFSLIQPVIVLYTHITPIGTTLLALWSSRLSVHTSPRRFHTRALDCELGHLAMPSYWSPRRLSVLPMLGTCLRTRIINLN